MFTVNSTTAKTTNAKTTNAKITKHIFNQQAILFAVNQTQVLQKKKKKKPSFCVIQNQAGPSLTLQESHANADNCLKFISLLSGPCQELANSEPGTIPKLLPRLLNIVRVIWMNSEHYHSRERLNGLLRKVRVLKFVTCSVKFSQNFGLQAHEGLRKGLEARNVLASYPGSFT